MSLLALVSQVLWILCHPGLTGAKSFENPSHLTSLFILGPKLPFPAHAYNIRLCFSALLIQ